MKAFISTNKQNVKNEFEWFVTPGELLKPDAENIPVDEFTIRPTDISKKGTYTIQVLVGNNEAKVVNQTRLEDESVTGKGIYEAMLPELYEHYNKTIISSSLLVPTFPGEHRVKKMTNIYEDLLNKGVVSYDRVRDVYIFSK